MWNKMPRLLLKNLTLMILAASSAAVSAQQAATPAKPVPSAPAAVAAASPKTDSIRVLVLPAGETVLASPVAGRITKLHVGLGLSFRQGAVLVSLDCDEPQARLGMAKADLAAASDQYEAKLRMQGLDQASDVEVSLAASAVAKSKAQIDLYQFQISQCAIRAPWDGQTAKLHVRSHMTITAGQPLLDLVRNGLLLIKLNVPSRWISSLKMGQQFDIAIDETGKTYTARVQRINSRVDPVSQTIELEASMLKSHPDLRPGMSGVARFVDMR